MESSLTKQVSEYKGKIHQLEAKNKSWEECCNTQNIQLKHLKRELDDLQRAFKISEDAQLLKRHISSDIPAYTDSLSDSSKKQTKSDLKEEDKSKPRSYMRPTSASTHKKRERSINVPKEIPLNMISPKAPKAKPKFKCPQSNRDRSDFRQSKTDRSTVISELSNDESFNQPESAEESLRLQISRLEQEIVELNRRYKQALVKASEQGADLGALRIELNSLASTMESRSSDLYDLKKQHQTLLREKISKT